MLHLKIKRPDAGEWETIRVEDKRIVTDFVITGRKSDAWDIKLIDIDVPIWKDIDWMSLMIGALGGAFFGIVATVIVTVLTAI